MKNTAARRFYYPLFLLLAFCRLNGQSAALNSDSLQALRQFSGIVSVTNNGLSLIPTFSLGKPALIFDVSLRNKRLSFDPQLRFNQKGQPWSFIFWFHYRLIQHKKFTLSIGAHPSYVFRTVATEINGAPVQTYSSRRYLAGDFSPNYKVRKNITVGLYYLVSHGTEAGTANFTHFLMLNSNFSHIKLGKKCYGRLVPQLYYLKIDNNDGFYVTSTFTIAKERFPLTISAVVNQPIESTIIGGQKLVWNVSLNYVFNHTYSKKN